MAETVKKETTKPKNIHQRMLEVVAAVERIPKRGRNDFHHYDYATEADILEAVRGAMVNAGLMIYPSLAGDASTQFTSKDGKVTNERRVFMDYTIVNAEDPSEIMVLTFPGEAHDTGDKAIYKALTGAEKYFLMKTFMIPTGDDPEDDEKPPTNPKSEHPIEKPGVNLAHGEAKRKAPMSEDPGTATTPQLKTIHGISDELGIDEEKRSRIKKMYGVESTKDLSVADASDFISTLYEAKKAGPEALEVIDDFIKRHEDMNGNLVDTPI